MKKCQHLNGIIYFKVVTYFIDVSKSISTYKLIYVDDISTFMNAKVFESTNAFSCYSKVILTKVSWLNREFW